MVKKIIENGYAEMIKIFGILLTLGGVIVGITLFVADRPTRAEVKEQIEVTINARIDRLEKLADSNAEKIDKIYNILVDK